MSGRGARISLLASAIWLGSGCLFGAGVGLADEEDDEPDRMHDSDGDGIPDFEEDANHNHRVDHGETDPLNPDTDGDGADDGVERRKGTDPAHNALIDFPEPMVFDMVRGLGSEQGEIEANTLVLVPTDPAHVFWAPEIEAAVIDRLAIELELGIYNVDLEVLKLALQGTVALQEDGSHGHGLQGLVEYLIDEDAILATALYILGVRLAPAVTWVSLIGPAIESHVGGETYGGFLVNFSFAYAPHPRVVVATEQNIEWFPSFYLIRWMPQVHWQACSRFQWQAGFGLLHIDRHTAAEAATRLILEF